MAQLLGPDTFYATFVPSFTKTKVRARLRPFVDGVAIPFSKNDYRTTSNCSLCELEVLENVVAVQIYGIAGASSKSLSSGKFNLFCTNLARKKKFILLVLPAW
eukprot:3773497-Amphidinium_carterae.1